CIRTRGARARLPEDASRRGGLEDRAGQLEKAHAARWLGPLRAALDRPRGRQLDEWRFRRGFLDWLQVLPRRAGFLSQAAPVLAREPLRELELGGGYGGLERDEGLGELARARCLPALASLRRCGVSPPA